MVACACLGGQLQVSGDGAPLAFGADAPVALGFGIGPVVNIAAPEQRIVFAVGDDELSQGLGLNHGFFHHAWVLDSSAVIGEGDDLGGKGRHVGKDPALLALCDGGIGVDGNAGVFADGIQLGL